VPQESELIDGGELGYELRHEATPLGFRLAVPPGRHDLAISFGADAVRHHHDEPTLLRQFAYVLSPARTWADFGGLDVTVHVPPGWRAAVAPAMRHEGDTLRATFATVPADSIALTVQAPAGWYTPVKYATLALFALVALGGGFVVARWTRARERRRQLSLAPASVLVGLGRGLVWGLAVSATGVLAIQGPELVLPDGQADHRDYALALFGVVFAPIVATAIGAIVSVVVTRGERALPGADGT
jgi:hypothetical protein